MAARKQWASHLAAGVTILIWGTTFISTKVLLQAFSPVEILFLRFAVGYIALWCACPRPLRLLDRKREWYFVAAGFCGVTLYYLFENIALTYTLASNVGVIISIAPFFTAVFSCLFLKTERPGPAFYAGFLLAILGICLISFQGGGLSLNPFGDFLAVVAAVIWAAYSTITRKISAFGYPTIQTTRRSFFYGLFFMLPVLSRMGFHPAPALILSPGNLLNLLFLGLGASALCFVTWNLAVKALGAVKTSVYIYLVPVITTVTSALILRERVTGAAVCGILLTLAGLFLSEYKRKKEQKSYGFTK